MINIKSLLIAGALTLPVLAITAPEAKADLEVCNKSDTKAYIAIAWYAEGHWRSTGWTHVFPGECETVFNGDMSENSVYVYAADDHWEPWTLEDKKTGSFCLRQSAFNLVDADGECVGDMMDRTFYRLTSDRSYDYRLNLR